MEGEPHDLIKPTVGIPVRAACVEKTMSPGSGWLQDEYHQLSKLRWAMKGTFTDLMLMIHR